ncbi:MAG: DUF6144 family protein [Candidatus Hodarchaeota archaeon]
MENKLEKKEKLLRLAGDLLSSIVRGLNQIDLETRKKIMELCGEVCAKDIFCGGGLDIAERIAEEEDNEERILERVNKEILWCGTWTKEGKSIQSICKECGCPLVKNRVVDLTGTFCYCSRGWVKKIFETLLNRPVDVKLEKSIGRGDKICKFVVHM